MKPFIPFLIGAAAFAVSAFAAVTPPMTSDEILQAHTDARGGLEAIQAVDSMDVRLTIDEGWVATGQYQANRDGSMRIDVYIGEERVFTEALLDDNAWSMQQGETTGTPITEEEAQILWRGVLGNLYAMQEWPDHGVEVNARGPEMLDGEDYWIIDITHEDGFQDRYYLDVDTFLIARQRSDHSLHPAVDPSVQRFETRYSDYREVDGIMFAFREEKYDLDTGERAQLVTIQSREFNRVADRAAFERPQ
jgi:hypothetical protein